MRVCGYGGESVLHCKDERCYLLIGLISDLTSMDHPMGFYFLYPSFFYFVSNALIVHHSIRAFAGGSLDLYCGVPHLLTLGWFSLLYLTMYNRTITPTSESGSQSGVVGSM